MLVETRLKCLVITMLTEEKENLLLAAQNGNSVKLSLLTIYYIFIVTHPFTLLPLCSLIQTIN